MTGHLRLRIEVIVPWQKKINKSLEKVIKKRGSGALWRMQSNMLWQMACYIVTFDAFRKGIGLAHEYSSLSRLGN